ncbi:uncharacterized protein LOC122729800 [Dromiciops gliroides]|uniref:uncharacterized protein LOC122729800 n=1 Tax=Dromiciops gliroides TaxID=33562 RepID=UPI001CC443FA|nr:uncharacterized protein LOC122729800 [Dromiciops gliroides]
MNQEVQIFEVLRDLKDAEFEVFKKIVSQHQVEASTWSLPTASRVDIASHLVSSYGSRALSVVAQTLDRVPVRHLREKLEELRLKDCTWEQETSITSHTRREAPIGLAEPVVTQETLMKLSRHVGHEWRELGIMCLGLQQHQLDRLEEDNPFLASMRIFHMFLLWRNREKEKATATRLYQLLSSESISISHEALAVLQEAI